MKLFLFNCLLFVFLVLFSGGKSREKFEPEHLYSTDELRADFVFLRKKLEDKHPNLYLYTTKKELDLTFDSLYKSIDKPGTSLALYNCITALYAKIKDGHTFFLPNPKTIAYYNKVELFLPFDVRCAGNKMYVIHNCTSDSTIRAGDEIISINAISAEQIITTLRNGQVRDGNNLAYANWIINSWFREYYSYSFGHPHEFTLVYKDYKDVTYEQKTRALHKPQIGYNRRSRYGIIRNAPGISLQFDPKLDVATLQIRSFDNAILKQQYHQHFKPATDSIFNELFKSKVNNLILDLRDNQGGDPKNAKLLLSYLLDTSFTLVYKGPASGTVKPNQQTFSGKLFCLINGGSFSATSMVSSCLQLHRRAVFVGNETGGNKTILSGSANKVHLPNTGIYCEISTRSWQLVDRANDGRGTLPDYTIVPYAHEVVKGFDAEKEFAIRLVKSGK